MKKAIVALILIVSTLTILSCSKTESYSARGKWEYINQSSHSLKIVGWISFDLPIGESHSFELLTSTGEVATPDEYTLPYDPGDFKIILDGTREVTTSPITDINNYTAERIDDRHYKFTYTFTDDDFPED